MGAKVYDLATGKNTAQKRLDKTLDFIRRDRVSELNKTIYEDTSIGRFINENSNLKYDSAGAKSVRKAAEVTGKVAAATAATILSGGIAAPVILGAFYGSGSVTEKYAQSVDRENGEKYDYKRASLKFVANAATGAVEWWGYGQLDSAAISGVKALSALKASGANLSVSSIVSKIPKLSNMSLKEAMHFGNFKRVLKFQLISKEYMLPTAATTVDHAVNFILGDETGTEALKKIGTEFLINFGFATFGATVESYSISRATQIDDILKSDAYLSDVAKYIRKYSDGTINKIDLADSMEKAAKKYAEASGLAGKEYNAFFKNFRDHTLPHTIEVADYVSTHAISGVKKDETILVALYHDLGMSGGIMEFSTKKIKNIEKEKAKFLEAGFTSKQAETLLDNGYDSKIVKKLLKSGFRHEQVEDILLTATKTDGYVSIDSLHNYLNTKNAKLRNNISEFLANSARKNHSPNSGVIIATTDIVPEGIDRDVVSLLASSHSKSTSGILDIESADQWFDAIDKLDKRIKTVDPNSTFNAEKLKKIIRNPEEFKRLQQEAVLIRDGDAMAAPVYKIINGEKYLMMQDGTYSKLEFEDLSHNKLYQEAYNPYVDYIKYERLKAKDYRYDRNGNIISDRVGNQKIDSYFSRSVHQGEYNTSYASKTAGSKYSANIVVNDPRHAPAGTVEATFERIGEVVTYTNYKERKVVIEFPEYMKNADNEKLLKWYQEAISFKRQDAVKKLAANKGISQETFEKLESWYENDDNFIIMIGNSKL